MKTFDVELPLPPKVLSPNVRSHWAIRARATRKYREDCRIATLAAKPKGWEGSSPIEIDVVYRAFRGCGGYQALDAGNAVAALKAGIDGIVDAGVIPSDSKRWLQWGEFRLVTTAREAKNRAGVFVRVKQA